LNILIDINHPGHVHLFRNAALNWIKKGHGVVFTIRDRDIIADLMKAYGFEYFVASRAKTTTAGLFYELLEHDWNVLKAARTKRADILIGTSASIGLVSKLMGVSSIAFSEDDADYIKLEAFLSYSLVDRIVIPDILRDKRTRKYVTHKSYHELAYLHPNHFTPDPTILSELGVSPGEPYFVIRLVALKASHDSGHAGLAIGTRRKIIQLLSQFGKVFITAEAGLPAEFMQYKLPVAPSRIHHVLSYATLLVSDSQTMTVEAAVLGTPSIRYNTFVGLSSVIEELENKYQLTYGFLPKDEDKMLEKISELIYDPGLKAAWLEKRQRMLQDKVDLAAWIENFVENYYQRK
jgi:predicted glycosyltransferase